MQPEFTHQALKSYTGVEKFWNSQDWMQLWNQHVTLTEYKQVFVAIQRGLEQLTKQLNKGLYQIYLKRLNTEEDYPSQK